MSPHYKLDLHTHSSASRDGSITEEEYVTALREKKIDYVAITDHNTATFALYMHKQYGERYIVGEEIRTTEGEIIGLFLKETIPPQLTLVETIRQIRKQQGVVYIPHPFTHNRFGVADRMVSHLSEIALIEHFNPRNVIPRDNETSKQFAVTHKKPMVASSDAHCSKEMGKTYSLLPEKPTSENIAGLFDSASYACVSTSFWHRFCPKKNTLRHVFFSSRA